VSSSWIVNRAITEGCPADVKHPQRRYCCASALRAKRTTSGGAVRPSRLAQDMRHASTRIGEKCTRASMTSMRVVNSDSILCHFTVPIIDTTCDVLNQRNNYHHAVRSKYYCDDSLGWLQGTCNYGLAQTKRKSQKNLCGNWCNLKSSSRSSRSIHYDAVLLLNTWGNLLSCSNKSAHSSEKKLHLGPAKPIWIQNLRTCPDLSKDASISVIRFSDSVMITTI
jgi:hypothetical protein